MNEMTNLMLGVLLPGMATAPPGAQPGATPNAGDTSGSAFQDLLMQTLDGADPQAGAAGSWAGQQTSQESTETPKTEASTADQTKLLGSIDMVSSALTAAQAVQVTPVTPVVSDPQPQTQASEPAPEVQTVDAGTVASSDQRLPEVSADTVADGSLTAYAAPVISEPAMVSPDVQTAQSSPDVAPAPSAQADVPMAQIPDARMAQRTAPVADAQAGTLATSAVDAQAETPATPIADNASDAVVARTPDTQVAQTASGQTAQTAAASTNASDTTPQPVRQSRHIRHAHHAADAQAEAKQADKADGITAKRNPGLPDIPAPSTGAPAFDYTKLRLNAKLDVEADDHAQLTQSAAPLARTAVAQVNAGDAVAVNPDGAQDKLTTGKTAVVPQVAHDIVAALPIKQMAENKQDALQDHKSDSPALTVSDVKPSFEKTVAGAEHSQGFHAPERVTEQKVISQVVQSAKLQLVDGGAHMAIRLDPPHLGVLNMSVTAQQGSVVANIQTSTEAARHVLQSDLSSLKQALADAGITVDSINVSLSNTPDQPGTPNGGQHAQGNSHGKHVGSQFVQELLGAEPEPTVLMSRAQQAVGMIDYLA
jgi:flagellar hook-length control protein FliK